MPLVYSTWLLCTMSGEMAHGVFVQHEAAFPWLKDDFLSHLFSFMWAFILSGVLLFCSVRCSFSYSVAGTDSVINSELFSFAGY